MHKKSNRIVSLNMKNKFGRIAMILVPIIIGISMICVIQISGGNIYGATLFESEQDYKLKFVDSTDFLSLSEMNSAILPFEIVGVVESSEGIIVTTYENSVILAPLDCKVVSNSSISQTLELESGGVRVILKNIISGVKKDNKILCGEVIGTVDGNSCIIQVYLGSKKLTLQELKAVL